MTTCTQDKHPDYLSEHNVIACCLQIFLSPAQGLASYSPQARCGPAPCSARRVRWGPVSASAQVHVPSTGVTTQDTRPAKRRMSTIQPFTGKVCRPRQSTVSPWRKGPRPQSLSWWLGWGRTARGAATPEVDVLCVCLCSLCHAPSQPSFSPWLFLQTGFK